MQKLEVGTLISDNDKLGVITKVIEMGTLDVEIDIINWRANYEIHYTDGMVSILGCATVDRLVKEKKIKIISKPTTPLPPSSLKSSLHDYAQMQEQLNRNTKNNKRHECGAKKNKKKDQ